MIIPERRQQDLQKDQAAQVIAVAEVSGAVKRDIRRQADQYPAWRQAVPGRRIAIVGNGRYSFHSSRCDASSTGQRRIGNTAGTSSGEYLRIRSRL